MPETIWARAVGHGTARGVTGNRLSVPSRPGELLMEDVNTEDNIDMQLAVWRTTGKPPRWVAAKLRRMGLSQDRIRDLINSQYGVDYAACCRSRRIGRLIGLGIALLGLSLNVWSMTACETHIVVSGFFVAILLAGIAVVTMPGSLGIVIDVFAGRRRRQ